MREIKFRAWDGLNIIDNVSIMNGRYWYKEKDGQRGDFYKINDYEIMQYTGLKDKNGKDIYEGDIVKTKKGNAQIKYYEEYACFGILGRLHYAMIPIARLYYENPEFVEDFEVIGNIYENPELITPNRTHHAEKEM